MSFFISPKDFEKLTKMQDKLNKLTCKTNFGHHDWLKMEFDWGLAIIDECMEVQGHLGWKWWKSSKNYKTGVTDANRKQLQLECIDLLHFMLSMSMQTGKPPRVMVPLGYTIDGCLTSIMAAALNGECDWWAWRTLCDHFGITSEEVVKVYTGKFALNTFRQEHGYNEGTYDKFWLVPEVSALFQEDNWWLEKVMAELDFQGKPHTVAAITAGLKNYYTHARNLSGGNGQ